MTDEESTMENPHRIELDVDEAKRIANSLEILYHYTDSDTHEPTDEKAAEDAMMIRARAGIEPNPELVDDD